MQLCANTTKVSFVFDLTTYTSSAKAIGLAVKPNKPALAFSFKSKPKTNRFKNGSLQLLQLSNGIAYIGRYPTPGGNVRQYHSEEKI